MVAKKLGRNWIGIEKEKKYYEMAKKRVRNTARYPGSGDKNAIDGQQAIETFLSGSENNEF